MRIFIPTLIAIIILALPVLPNNKMQPKKAIFWDLDSVVFRRTKTLSAAWHYPHKGLALQKMTPALNKEIGQLLWRKTIGKPFAKELLVDAARRHANPYLAEFIITATNAKKPIKKTVAIMQELKNLGYRQYTGSNMGKSFFDDLMTRPENQFLKECCDLDHSVYVSVDGLERNIRKPHPEFYQELIKLNPDLTPADVIFIDNDPRNVRGARAVGMTALLFKTPQKLRKKLTQMGILPASTPINSQRKLGWFGKRSNRHKQIQRTC